MTHGDLGGRLRCMNVTSHECDLEAGYMQGRRRRLALQYMCARIAAPAAPGRGSCRCAAAAGWTLAQWVVRGQRGKLAERPGSRKGDRRGLLEAATAQRWYQAELNRKGVKHAVPPREVCTGRVACGAALVLGCSGSMQGTLVAAGAAGCGDV